MPSRLPRVAACVLVLAGCGAGGDAVVVGTASSSPDTSALQSLPPAISTPPASSPSESSIATTAVAPPPIPSTALPGPTSSTLAPVTTAPVSAAAMLVGWVGGSEVVLREISVPAYANEIGVVVDGRPLLFEPFTQIAPTPEDTERWIAAALGAGAEALIVTFNPQWLYGRTCDGIDVPHTRYACLLADGPVVGGEAIDHLVATIVASGVPVLVVLTPTSVDALESPELADSIRLANERLAGRVPGGGMIKVVDQVLTAGVPEFREGAGFHDMVHTTPEGARLLAERVVGELVGWLDA